jgi:hypothetical protein
MPHPELPPRRRIAAPAHHLGRRAYRHIQWQGVEADLLTGRIHWDANVANSVSRTLVLQALVSFEILSAMG